MHKLQSVNKDIKFQLISSHKPAGDQPRAIEQLVKNLSNNAQSQVLLGVTGSGKTFTIANVIAAVERPTLVIAHNKTLAAQLYSEFSELFPHNAVRYFVSYYDYYQPEAYLPATDTYIEKDSAINVEIDKLRHSTTKSLLERRDVIVVASVSCIYGLGDPRSYFEMIFYVECGDKISRKDVQKKLVILQYKRNDVELNSGTFRVRGDVIEICPVDESERSIRIEFFGDEIEAIREIDRITGRTLRELPHACVYPASHYVIDRSALDRAIVSIKEELAIRVAELDRVGKTLESQRLEQRTMYDLEMLEEMGFCSGIENYSRHLTGRAKDEAPPTLIDYFPKDMLVMIDESHVSIGQLRGMYRGDRSRKGTLVEHGFRLPSALDNRPLRYDELEEKLHTVIYVSATPSEYELERSRPHIVEQIIRPTGLLDPVVEVRLASSQVEDFFGEVNAVSARGERALLTTLTKRLAENLTQYYLDMGVRVRYLHADVHTLDRIDLIRALRMGEYDLLIGINLLREGLDLPEVSLVGIMDADKEGFLRSETSLIQTIGRAARHINGRVILYADNETRSIKAAVSKTNRRRKLQKEYNDANGIIPKSVSRAHEVVMVAPDMVQEAMHALDGHVNDAIPTDIYKAKELIDRLKKEMFASAQALAFEKAAQLRDKIAVIEKYMLSL